MASRATGDDYIYHILAREVTWVRQVEAPSLVNNALLRDL